ncbi:MAG: hypothetical protein JRS35_21185 [Deltaproteobacteria bacterium]|nr:hypothetical protein [Deltaproteobacteria bacterium]
MLGRIRGFTAALVASAVLLSGAAPALAFTDEGLAASERHTPALFDAFVLRPMGLLITAVGAVAFVPAGAFVGITRPTDIGKPFHALVAVPFRYTFLDPLGEHPATRMLDQ